MRIQSVFSWAVLIAVAIVVTGCSPPPARTYTPQADGLGSDVTTVDETEVDETVVDETAVDEQPADEAPEPAPQDEMPAALICTGLRISIPLSSSSGM